MSSALLTKQIAQQAITIVAAGIIEEFIKKGNGRMAAAIIVLDPTIPFRPLSALEALDGRHYLPVVHEEIIGEQDPAKWPAGRDYAAFARAKALVSWRTGLPTHLVQRDSPHLFQSGDFKYGGSAIVKGIIVATSGLEWYHDLAVSEAVAGMCHALTIGAAEPVLAGKDSVFIQ